MYFELKQRQLLVCLNSIVYLENANARNFFTFITDPLSELNPKKDTTIVWMQEAYEMGSQILQCEMKDLIYKDQQTYANCVEIPDPNDRPQIINKIDDIKRLKDIDYIFMRKTRQ